MQRIRDALRRVRLPALAVFTAFVLGAIVIVLTDFEHLRAIGTDPLGALGGALGGVLEGYPALLAGAIGDPDNIVAAIQSGSPGDIAAALRPISETLVSATPFIFVCLGLAVSFQAGLFNLGVDGQWSIGSLGAFIAATMVAGHLPSLLALVVAVLGGIIAGGAYAFIAGFLKARTGAHEVITTLMLNGLAPSVAFLILTFITLPEPQAALPAVPPLIDLRTVRVDYGFVVALFMAVLVSLLLFRSTLGFEFRATGFSRVAARGAGIRPGRTMMLAMFVSGGLVGMGSALFGLGPAQGFSGGPVIRPGLPRRCPRPARRPAAQRRRPRGPALRRAHHRREEHGHRDRHPARAAHGDRGLRHHACRGARPDPLDLAAQASQAERRISRKHARLTRAGYNAHPL